MFLAFLEVLAGFHIYAYTSIHDYMYFVLISQVDEFSDMLVFDQLWEKLLPRACHDVFFNLECGVITL
jgi:hypothetical protein